MHPLVHLIEFNANNDYCLLIVMHFYEFKVFLFVEFVYEWYIRSFSIC